MPDTSLGHRDHLRNLVGNRTMHNSWINEFAITSLDRFGMRNVINSFIW